MQANATQVNSVEHHRDEYLTAIREVLAEMNHPEAATYDVDMLLELGEQIALEGRTFDEVDEEEALNVESIPA